MLVTSPTANEGYENVTKLKLSHNHIDNIDWVPQHLMVSSSIRYKVGINHLFMLQLFDLDHNNLTSVPDHIMDTLSNCSVKFDHNPWNCDCSTVTLKKYLLQNIKKVIFYYFFITKF